MRLPTARGPLSAAVVEVLTGPPSRPTAGPTPWRMPPEPADLLADDDLQLALWVMYQLHYAGFAGVDDGWEWHPTLLALRAQLEARLTTELLRRTSGRVRAYVSADGDVSARLFAMADEPAERSVASFLQRDADRAQFLEFLTARSLYHLQESDPASFVLPRLSGPAKVALAELQYDEYGAGRPARLHSSMFADALASCGLATEYGTYVERAPAVTLAVTNAMNLLALHRSTAAAAMGHLAAFEASSSGPCRQIVGGIDRLGLPAPVREYFDEHVEADAVHEQVAVRDLCGSLAADRPACVPQLFFGAAVCQLLDGLAGEAMLTAWQAGASSLRAEDGGFPSDAAGGWTAGAGRAAS